MRRAFLVTSLLAGVLAFGSMSAHADTYADNNFREDRSGTQVRARDARGTWQNDGQYGRSEGQRSNRRGQWNADRRNHRGGQYGGRQRGGGQMGSCQSGRSHGSDPRRNGGDRGQGRRMHTGQGNGQWNQDQSGGDEN